MKSQTLTFPAPITYIGKVKVTSTSKDASGFYDELNQQQYNGHQAFKEQLTKENILSNFDVYDNLYLLLFLRASKFDLPNTKLMFTNFLK